MDKQTFERAKYIQEKIQHIEVKLTQIRLMKERRDDEDFNILRALAYDGLTNIKEDLYDKFKSL